MDIMNNNSIWIARIFAPLSVIIMMYSFISGQYWKTDALQLPKIVEQAMQDNSTLAIIDPTQLQCLRENIYFESRNQSLLGQFVVGLTVLNRVEHGFGDTICDVVFAKYQFSWANNGRKPPKLKNDAEILAWQKSAVVARFLLRYPIPVDNTLKSVVNYHTQKVHPTWSKSKKLATVGIIGDHVFYKNRNG